MRTFADDTHIGHRRPHVSDALSSLSQRKDDTFMDSTQHIPLAVERTHTIQDAPGVRIAVRRTFSVEVRKEKDAAAAHRALSNQLLDTTVGEVLHKALPEPVESSRSRKDHRLVIVAVPGNMAEQVDPPREVWIWSGGNRNDNTSRPKTHGCIARLLDTTSERRCCIVRASGNDWNTSESWQIRTGDRPNDRTDAHQIRQH